MPEDTGDDRSMNCSIRFALGDILKAFKLARDPRKLVLASAAIVCVYLAGRVLDAVWADGSKVLVTATGQNEINQFRVDGFNAGKTRRWIDIEANRRSSIRRGAFAAMMDEARGAIVRVSAAVFSLNIGGVLTEFVGVFALLMWLVLLHPLYALLFLLVFMAVWAFFGAAICRQAALHATRDEQVTLADALGFARRKFWSFFTAPLLPLGAVALIAFAMWIGGMIGAIPGLGTFLTPLLWFLPLIGGFIMALALIGLALGWPLMYPTIAVEGSDAFDAVSRSFAYVGERIWRTVLYGIVALGYGAICLWFVKFFARLTLFLVHLFVGLSMNWGSASGPSGNVADKLDAMWKAPAMDFSTTFYGEFGHVPLSGLSRFGAFILALWTFGVLTVVGGVLVSYLHSASTLVYLQLRRDVDATDIEEVYLEEQESGSEPVGSPSSENPAPADQPPAGSLSSLPVVGDTPKHEGS